MNIHSHQVVVYFKGKNVNGSPCKVVVTSEAEFAPEPECFLKEEIVKKPDQALYLEEFKGEKNEDREVKVLMPSLEKLVISGQVKEVENKARVKVSHDMDGEACIRDVGMLRGKGRNEGTKAMEKVKKQLRSVLIPHKNGLLLDDVSKEYREMVSNVTLCLEKE